MTNTYLEPCKKCLLKMCCSQVCQEFVDFVEKEHQLGYMKQKFPVPMNRAGMHISLVKNGIVNDMSLIRLSEYERSD